MTTRFAAVACILLLSAALAAQEATSPPATPSAAAAPMPMATVVADRTVAERAPAGPQAPNPAIDFLGELEARNSTVNTLWGKFTQVRESPVFLETTTSEGEFWYVKPDRFRCDYKTPTESRFYIIGDTALSYTPEIKQVDKYQLESGDEAPINQMLVGFGLNTSKILDVFEVQPAANQPADAALFTIEFKSRDAERTLEYDRIEVTFDRATREPRRMFLDQGGEDGDKVDIELLAVTRDAAIGPEKFELTFPPDVEVNEF